jgi:hypothetical protein
MYTRKVHRNRYEPEVWQIKLEGIRDWVNGNIVPVFKNHTLKVYGGSGGMTSLASSVFADLPPRKETAVHVEREAGWASEPVWTCWRAEIQYILRNPTYTGPR